jgi:CBS domain-containing protein
MRVPLTAVIFALELTHDINVLLPLLLATTIAYAVTVLLLKRSILTEKISRRGYHLSREYAVDPLEIIFAREVVRTGVAELPASATPDRIAAMLADGTSFRERQRLFPVVNEGRHLVGVITRRGLLQWLGEPGSTRTLGAASLPHPVVAYDDEPLRLIVFRMAETGLTRLPVITRGQDTFMGMIGLKDLLTARTRILDAEQRRERVLLLWPGGARDGSGASKGGSAHQPARSVSRTDLSARWG